jgi:hypothetical protein
MQYTDKERAHAIDSMRKYLGADGTPNWTRASRECAMERRTLRRMWAKHLEDSGQPPPAAEPEHEEPAAMGDAERAWASRQLGEPDLAHRDVEFVAGLLHERDTAIGTARAQNTKLLADKVLELRRSDSGRVGPQTPDEIVAWVVQMPEVALAAWLASPELWTDERWTSAQEGG